MLPVPPAELEVSGLAEGDVVLIDAAPGRVTITPAAPDLDPAFVLSVDRAMRRYRRAWQELAQR